MQNHPSLQIPWPLRICLFKRKYKTIKNIHRYYSKASFHRSRNDCRNKLKYLSFNFPSFAQTYAHIHVHQFYIYLEFSVHNETSRSFCSRSQGTSIAGLHTPRPWLMNGVLADLYVNLTQVQSIKEGASVEEMPP